MSETERIDVDPGRAALIIQDLQNDVMADGGAFAESGAPQHAKEQNVVENVKDLAAFCRGRAGATTTRRLRSLGIRRRRGLVEVRLVADAFCWQMVRGIVGHLLLVGDGRRDPASTVAVLAAADRSRAGNIAPAHGLVLEAVTYPGGSGGLRKPKA